MNNFYTYAYLREDGTPYYIGKGKDRRAYSSQRRISVPKDKDRILILKQNLTEEDAFKHEKYMIAILGRKDLGTGILRNFTDGGDGTSGAVISEEHRKKISEANKGEKHPFYGKTHTKETKLKISESTKGEKNHFYGKTHTEETKRRIVKVNKGKKHSEESKKKMSESRTGE